MKHIDFFLFFLLIIITLSALIKANLVFEYKRSFEYLDKIQEKISSLKIKILS